MKSRFEMSMIWEMTFFLGLQVNQSPCGIFINQSKYVLEILNKYGMESCDPVGTPMEIKDKLDLDQNGTPAKPTEKHLKESKRIFRYLRGTVNTGLWYTKDSSFEVTGFSDADYAGCKDTFKSTSNADYAGCKETFKSTFGGAQFFGEKLVSWSLKKQNCTVLSIAEAEYASLSACCAQVLWMRTQLTDYGFHFNKIPIYCDSKSAIAISCNPVQHSRTKHIIVRYYFIKEHVEKGTIELYFVKTDYQLADIFTKALPTDRFNYLVRCLVTNENPSRVNIKQLCGRGRSLASFQNHEHEGGDTRSQGGIKDNDLKIKIQDHSMQMISQINSQEQGSKIQERKYTVLAVCQIIYCASGFSFLTAVCLIRETLAEGEEGAFHLGPERPRVYSDLSPEEKDRSSKNSKYFKDKMLLMQAQENRAALDEEQLLFILGGQDNAVDEDVDEHPVQDLALNVDNVFQADNYDAFDSDVDEALLHRLCSWQIYHPQILFMMKLVRLMIRTFYLSDMLEQHAQHVPVTTQNKVVDNSLSTELTTYKERVELGNTIYELRDKVYRLTKKHSDTDPSHDLKALDCQNKELHAKVNSFHDLNERCSVTGHHKSNCVTMLAVKPKVLAPGMYVIDVEPIPPRNRNNREVYLDYLKRIKESVTTLHEIVEEDIVEKPFDSSPASACCYTKHSQKMVEYVTGTCPNNFKKGDKQIASTPVTRKNQVTFMDPCKTYTNNTFTHVKQQTMHQTNEPMIPSTGVEGATTASGSKPRSNTKKDRTLPAKSDMQKVEVHP
nr:retrovirus-related Pol polyprotein from transposon TNT 1-94 [Tanacetum cinerariifolium]